MARRRPAGEPSEPRPLSGATIGGREHAIHHDAEGNVTRYECEAKTGCGDDTHIAWNGRNLPVRITLGDAEAKNPAARDEFAYGPDGARYHRKTTFPDGAAPRMEDTYYAGAYEELLPAPGSEYASIEQTRVTDAVRHVRTTAVKTTNGKKETVTSSRVDYLHKDHLGSVEGATGADGARTRELAYDPYGGRRKADWTAALPKSEIASLAGSSDPRTRGHTGHEHLDRTGLIHRGGRVYDPTLGRFLSPDPLVGNRGSAQAWNGYSYVSNSPMSFVDPSGLSQRPVGCGVGGLRCQGQGAAGGGLGLASVVSTHRFQWVDIFFSVASISSWIAEAWNSGSGIIYNYSGGGVGDGGWGYASPAPFVGIAHFSSTYQMTTQVGVEDTPDITRRPIEGIGSGVLDIGQAIIAAVGLIPVAGNAADAANAVISTARGNYEDAVLDTASAIPGTGQVTGVASAGVKFERGVAAIVGAINRSPTRATTDFLSDVTVISHGKVVGRGTVDLRGTLADISSGKLEPRNVFRNDEGLLPKKPPNYYQEFVHPTPDLPGAGPQRVVRGEAGELYYTPDHYASFIPLN